MTTGSLSYRIQARRDAAFRARSVIESVFGGDARAEDVKLATSELVSNAVKHAGLDDADIIRLEVDTVDDARVRVKVSYPGEPFSRSRQPQARQGYGFRIIDSLTAKWDIDQTGEEIIAWFEI